MHFLVNIIYCLSKRYLDLIFRAAKDYVMHVLFKEFINYLAMEHTGTCFIHRPPLLISKSGPCMKQVPVMEHLGLPYQLADERGRSTEVSKIEELKKVITDNYLYN